MFVNRVPKVWKYLVGISIFILLASGCRGAIVSTPTTTLPNQEQGNASSTPEIGTTLTPGNSPLPTNTPVPQSTIMPTFSSSATVEMAGEKPVTEEKKTYPQIAPADLYANPDDYFGKRFMLDGVVLGFGYRNFEGKEVYVIQVGVLEYPNPIIVLGFLPNLKLGMHDGFIVGGTGGGAYYGVDPTDPKSYTPVILGEWYECNLPWDQWKYPYEFWTPIQFDE